MCAKGNGSIYAECRDAIREVLGREAISNHEMRDAIRMLGDNGCMNHKQDNQPVDNKQELVLVSE